MNSETSIRVIGMLLMVPVVVCLGTMTRASAETLRIGDAHSWSFIGGAWSDGEGGLISPPRAPWNQGASAYEGQRTTNDDVLLAFYTGRAYADFEAEFKFRWDGPHCGAGFVFRAQDARHYYVAHFPRIAQAGRGSHFWAMISKVDDSGWTEMLRMDMLHGIPTPADKSTWYQARVAVTGNEFRLWVNGRPLPVVQDDTYTKPGLVGLEAWAWGGISATFEDLRIRGKSVQPKPWDATLQPVQNWFLPYPITGGQQSCSGITRAPNGDLLMAISPPGDIVRSLDNGRSWASLEPEGWPGGWLHTTRDGRLITLYGGEDIFMAESMDNGKTWSEPEKTERAPFVPPENVPDMKLGGHQGYLELHDGTLLAFRVGSVPGRGGDSGHNIYEWGTWNFCGYSVRSTDGGRSWSAPVPLNGPPAVGQKYDVCELSSNMQTKEGNVLSLGRPTYSPWMWESWSENNGESWVPMTSGPFPCYAATALATESGVLLVSGRMPGLGLYVSHDSGMTWQPYRVDTAGLWAMGTMYEVEPDLVFYIYMDLYASSMRAQFIRITADGAEPVREMLPIK